MRVTWSALLLRALIVTNFLFSPVQSQRGLFNSLSDLASSPVYVHIVLNGEDNIRVPLLDGKNGVLSLIGRSQSAEVFENPDERRISDQEGRSLYLLRRFKILSNSSRASCTFVKSPNDEHPEWLTRPVRQGTWSSPTSYNWIMEVRCVVVELNKVKILIDPPWEDERLLILPTKDVDSDESYLVRFFAKSAFYKFSRDGTTILDIRRATVLYRLPWQLDCRPILYDGWLNQPFFQGEINALGLDFISRANEPPAGVAAIYCDNWSLVSSQARFTKNAVWLREWFDAGHPPFGTLYRRPFED